MKLSTYLRRKTPASAKATGPSIENIREPSPSRSTRSKPGQAWFTLRTQLRRALGKPGSNGYQIDAVRMLPAPQDGRVIIQATDGHQAVCLIAPGSCESLVLVPGDVLPTRKTPRDIDIREEPSGGRHSGGWRSADGKQCRAIEPGGRYPAIADVLPELGQPGKRPPVTLGIDLELLNKIADALGTTKLTLMILPAPADGDYVNRPIAVCPANDEAGINGIAVVMPLTPERSATYYNKVRADVAKAESRFAGKDLPKPAIKRNGSKP